MEHIKAIKTIISAMVEEDLLALKEGTEHLWQLANEKTPLTIAEIEIAEEIADELSLLLDAHALDMDESSGVLQ